MPIKERCVRCGTGWTRDDSEARHPCPACGSPQWDIEQQLDNVGRGTEYEIYDERVDQNQVITLFVRWPRNTANNAVVPLSHRLSASYRHQKGNLAAKDGRGLLITFDKEDVGTGSGTWIISSLRRG